MNIYRFANYRDALRFLIESRQVLDPSLTFQKAAEVMRIQKSYLSRVLHDQKAEINPDQLFLLMRHLDLPDDAREYLFLLLDYSRSGLKDRKAALKKKIEAVQEEKAASESYLKVHKAADQERAAADYYLDALHQLVHVCLSHDEFRKNPEKMAARLGVQPGRVQEILRELHRLGFINAGKKGIDVLRQNIHLPKSSKLFRPWSAQMRQLALQRSMQVSGDETYNFSVIFSCSEAVRRSIQERFFKLLEESQKEVNASSPERVYQMGFDLLTWL
jgi:uncharacterized protein (TIGR02147 family)